MCSLLMSSIKGIDQFYRELQEAHPGITSTHVKVKLMKHYKVVEFHKGSTEQPGFFPAQQLRTERSTLQAGKKLSDLYDPPFTKIP